MRIAYLRALTWQAAQTMSSDALDAIRHEQHWTGGRTSGRPARRFETDRNLRRGSEGLALALAQGVLEAAGFRQQSERYRRAAVVR